jgi:hypothetical protein
VAEYIPELKAAYDYNSYSVSEWRHALNMFLQDDLEGLGFEDWAKYYPRVWGNVHGVSMFVTPEDMGSFVLFMSTSLFFMCAGNPSRASTNVLKLFVFIVSPFVVSQTL